MKQLFGYDGYPTLNCCVTKCCAVFKVRERRRAKEESKKKALERELLAREASRHALEEMKKEEEARTLRTKMEEKVIQHNMVAIRRQMTEQKERERYMHIFTHTILYLLTERLDTHPYRICEYSLFMLMSELPS